MANLGRHAQVQQVFDRNLVLCACVLVISIVATLIALFPAKANPNPSPISINDAICDLGTAGYLGDGTSLDPWKISDSESLWEVTDCEIQNPGGYYELISDIDATWTSNSPTALPIGYLGAGNVHKFQGTLRGQGYAVTGISFSSQTVASDSNRVTSLGLFATLQNASFSDMTLSGAVNGTSSGGNLANGASYACGTLAPKSEGRLTLRNITVKSEVVGVELVGGLVGWVQNVSASGVVMTGRVSGDTQVGGLFGAIEDRGWIGTSLNYASINESLPPKGNAVGGFIGAAGNQGEVTNSANFGIVRGLSFVGGLIGGAMGVTVSSSVNHGKVQSGSQAQNLQGRLTGGLLGWGGRVSMEDVANLGPRATFGSVAGGLLGQGGEVLLVKSQNLGQVASSNNSVGGLIGIVERFHVKDSSNLGQVQARSGVGGVAGQVSQLGSVVNFLGLGKIAILTGSNASEALREIATISDQGTPQNASSDGLVASGSVSASGVITTELTHEVLSIEREKISSTTTYAGWDLERTWGFDCRDLSNGPKLRALNLTGTALQQSCQPPQTNPEPDIEMTPSPRIEGDYSIRAGQLLTLRGTGLASVKRLQIGDAELQISSASVEQISVYVPVSISPGVYDLQFENDVELVVAIGAIRILSSPDPTKSALVGRSIPILKFARKTTDLSREQAGQVLHFISGQTSLRSLAQQFIILK